MSHTLDYYNHNAASYVENTRQADIHLLQEKFLALLNEGNTILDFGCGGQDEIQSIFLRKDIVLLQRMDRRSAFDWPAHTQE